MPTEMSQDEARQLPYEERVRRARVDAERYAGICFLPLEPQSNHPDIPPPGEDWSLTRMYARWNHGTKPADQCARDEIKGRFNYYNVPEPSAEETTRLLREAQGRAREGAARGQVRERDYGRY
jgi:hypothetical protein